MSVRVLTATLEEIKERMEYIAGLNGLKLNDFFEIEGYAGTFYFSECGFFSTDVAGMEPRVLGALMLGLVRIEEAKNE